jgi:hypothetical protein
MSDELKLVQFKTDNNSYYIEEGNRTIGFILHINSDYPTIHIKSKVVE